MLSQPRGSLWALPFRLIQPKVLLPLSCFSFPSMGCGPTNRGSTVSLGILPCLSSWHLTQRRGSVGTAREGSRESASLPRDRLRGHGQTPKLALPHDGSRLERKPQRWAQSPGICVPTGTSCPPPSMSLSPVFEAFLSSDIRIQRGAASFYPGNKRKESIQPSFLKTDLGFSLTPILASNVVLTIQSFGA